ARRIPLRLAKQWPDGPLVFGRDAEISAFVDQRIDTLRSGFGPCSTIGVVRFNKLLGGVVYHDFRPQYRDITVSFAFDDPRWATPSVMRSVCSYPFDQLG